MKSLLVLTACLWLSISAYGQWDRFRGPNGCGISEGAVPVQWNGKEHISWKTALPGPGTSSPIIVGNRIFVTSWSGYADGSKGEMAQLARHLVCLDKDDGRILWDRSVQAFLPEDPFEGMITEHGYASSTPTSDGQSVFVFFGKTGVLAFDMEGKQLWQTSVGTHSDDRKWGSAASPVLFGDLLVVNALTEGGAVVALDKKTGNQIWKAPAEGLQLAFSTPLQIGREIVIPVPKELWGINALDGSIKWRATHGLEGPISPAVVLGDGLAFVFGGSPKQGSMAIKPEGEGDITNHILWQTSTSSYVPSPIFFQGRLYVVNDQGFALCIEAKTGKAVYRERVLDRLTGKRRAGGGQPFYASPVMADGKLYCPSRRNGTFVVAAKPEFELLAINVIEDDDSQFNATPAVDHNRLYLRSDRFLYCIGNESGN